MPLKVDEAQFEKNGRLAGIAIALFTMRARERWRVNLTDYDCVMIMIAVIAITSEPLLKTGLDAEYRTLRKPIDPKLVRKANISSIAHATGLNRETTRRKVNSLVEDGLLARLEDGSVSFRAGLVQEDRIRDQVRGQLGEIVAIANQLQKIGVLTRG
jgi:hypothetical protein